MSQNFQFSQPTSQSYFAAPNGPEAQGFRPPPVLSSYRNSQQTAGHFLVHDNTPHNFGQGSLGGEGNYNYQYHQYSNGYYENPNYTAGNSSSYQNGPQRNYGWYNHTNTASSSSQNRPVIYDEDYSEKLIAFARFNRNNHLIKEILSDVVMPDIMQIVTTTRLNTLKDQVQLLESHYGKVDKELAEVEKTCSERKRKFLESTNEFNEKYEALCRPVVGPKKYSELFLKHYNQMKTLTAQQQLVSETNNKPQEQEEETKAADEESPNVPPGTPPPNHDETDEKDD